MGKKMSKKEKKRQKERKKAKDKIKNKNMKEFNKFFKKEKKLRVKSTLSKKDAKKIKKIIEKRKELPELKEIRRVCNHRTFKGNDTVFVESTSMTNHSERKEVKNLDILLEMFVPEAIEICEHCLVATPVLEELEPRAIEHAKHMIIGAAEHAVSQIKDEKEVKSFHKAVDEFTKITDTIIKKHKKLYEAHFVEPEDNMPRTKSGDIDYAAMSQ